MPDHPNYQNYQTRDEVYHRTFSTTQHFYQSGSRFWEDTVPTRSSNPTPVPSPQTGPDEKLIFKPINEQKPFSYLVRPKLPRQPINAVRTEFSANIKSLCLGCGHRFQKKQPPLSGPQSSRLVVAKIPGQIISLISAPHAQCGGGNWTITLPPELLPWQLRPLQSYYGDGSLGRFTCPSCRLLYCNWVIFGSNCTHQKHNADYAGYFTCRFCCHFNLPTLRS